MLALMEHLDEAKERPSIGTAGAGCCFTQTWRTIKRRITVSIGYWADENHIKPKIKR
jgi:hypothetical protein